MNDRYSNFVVACLCCTFAAFSPLVFANDVRVGVSPTTGYYEVTTKTFDVPKGATVSSSTAVSPTVTPLAGGGFQQSMGGGITIEGLKKPAPFTARAAASLQTMKNGAKNILKSNPKMFALSAGGALLFESLDWIMNEGGQIQKSTPSVPSSVDPTYRHYSGSWGGISTIGYTPESACSVLVGHLYANKYRMNSASAIPDPDNTFVCAYDIDVLGIGNTHTVYPVGAGCPSGAVFNGKYCDFQPVFNSVSLDDINSAVDSKYNPYAEDFTLLTPYMPPDFILVDPIPPVQTDLGITNTYDSTGALTGTEQKTSTTQFSISNNSSAQPAISASTSVKTETFKDGQSQGSTVTETTQPATGGGSKVEIPTVEIPTDCDFHPTLCKWLDWTKEEPEEPDDNLSNLLKEVPISSKTFTISGGAAACPAPLVLNLSQFGSREVSYQPLCDLASTMKFLYLALMSFAAAVLLHRSINRV